MKRIVLLVLLLSFAIPTFASTHKDVINVSCNELWRAVKDTLKNSGKYGIIAIDNSEMTASYNMGGNLMAKRTNSAMLNSKDNGASCELQVQTAYSGLGNNDAGDFKKRVEESLTKLKGQPLSNPNTAPEQPNAATAPAQTSLSVSSTPSGADIEIDGAFVGNTPSTVMLTPGSHHIVVKKKGFSDWTKTLNVTGGSVNLSAELDQAPAQ
ncbi:MAG: PEGA domain-containing protein [Terracidiphilus sp.]